MRRVKQQLTEEEAVDLLRSSTSGVLALCGLDMIPYGVPLSHAYNDGKLYFHSAMVGHKLDVIRQNPNACFTVIAQDELHPEKFTTYFKSVIAVGKIRIVENEAEKLQILQIVGRRCNPDDAAAVAKEIKWGIDHCVALEMTIDTLTGKQAIELVASPK